MHVEISYLHYMYRKVEFVNEGLEDIVIWLDSWMVIVVLNNHLPMQPFSHVRSPTFLSRYSILDDTGKSLVHLPKGIFGNPDILFFALQDQL